MKITKDMTIVEVLEINRQTAAVFMRNGMHCFGCPVASQETIEQAALGHGIDLTKLLEELNSMLNEE